AALANGPAAPSLRAPGMEGAAGRGPLLDRGRALGPPGAEHAEAAMTGAWFDGSRALVVGLARSGASAAKLLLRHGCEVRGVDRRRADELNGSVRELAKLGVDLRFGTTDPRELEGRNLVVVSPGVPLDLPLLTEAERRGIPIAAEIELGFAVARAPIVAVTGTNGKSTTVELLGAMGRAAERPTEVLGNIGT